MDREATRVKAKGCLGFLAAFCGTFALQLSQLIADGDLPKTTWVLVALAAMKAVAGVGVLGVAYTDKTMALYADAKAALQTGGAVVDKLKDVAEDASR